MAIFLEPQALSPRSATNSCGALSKSLSLRISVSPSPKWRWQWRYLFAEGLQAEMRQAVPRAGPRRMKK